MTQDETDILDDTKTNPLRHASLRWQQKDIIMTTLLKTLSVAGVVALTIGSSIAVTSTSAHARCFGHGGFAGHRGGFSGGRYAYRGGYGRGYGYRGAGLGVGLLAGALATGAVASSYGAPYYGAGYGYPAVGYGYPAYGYGYGY